MIGRNLRVLGKTPTFSPAGFLIRAAGITAVFAALHLAGAREHVGFLSGTAGPEGWSRSGSAAFGLGYVFFYFGTVLVAPVLVLAAGLLSVIRRRLDR